MSLTRGEVRAELIAKGWFTEPGAYVVVDGQFGSTGKGLLSCILADVSTFGPRTTHVTSNQGPNSGHTAYVPMFAGETKRIMLQQLPVAWVTQLILGKFVDGFQFPMCYLNGGAVIDPDILRRELEEFAEGHHADFYIHPSAAVILEKHKLQEAKGSVAAVASTGKGVGAAIASKILRENNTADQHWARLVQKKYQIGRVDWDWKQDVVLVEVPQGFSLGINSGEFHPYTTSRECTVMQAIADARIPAQKVRKVAACYRVYPIRVGNTADGYSGACYDDQRELTWDQIGVPPEYTSVTGRMRRVFSWSREQFRQSVAANRPDLIFVNFAQYMMEEEFERGFMPRLLKDYEAVMGRPPETVLVGTGPKNGDVRVWQL